MGDVVTEVLPGVFVVVVLAWLGVLTVWVRRMYSLLVEIHARQLAVLRIDE